MPTVMDWMTSISAVVSTAATVGLLVAAVVAGVFARRAWAQQKRANDAHDAESEAQRERKRRDQATQVSGWVLPAPLPSWATDERDRSYSIHLRNGSSAPIFDVVYRLNKYVDEKVDRGMATHLRVLAPGHTYSDVGFLVREEPRQRQVAEDGVFGREPYQYLIEMDFSDASGVRWHRADNGILEEAQA